MGSIKERHAEACLFAERTRIIFLAREQSRDNQCLCGRSCLPNEYLSPTDKREAVLQQRFCPAPLHRVRGRRWSRRVHSASAFPHGTLCHRGLLLMAGRGSLRHWCSPPDNRLPQERHLEQGVGPTPM